MHKRFITYFRQYKIECAIFLLIVILAIQSTCVLQHGKPSPLNVPITITILVPCVPSSEQASTPSRISDGACIDVGGIVSGNIIPGSKVSLYETPSTNYSVVMNRIRTTHPMDWTTVNETEGFTFSCLPQGQYAFAIPATSYNGTVGAPLPYEFDCQDLSLRIAFQGGDYQYMVGAFTIENSTRSKTAQTQCSSNPLLCQDDRGSLYRECPANS